MSKWVYGILILACLLPCGCRTSDKRTVTISIPEMKNNACVNIVANALASRAGVDGRSIRVDLTARTITLTYDSMQLAIKNLEFAVADAGFTANGIPANPQAAAKLPADCRTAAP